MKLFLFKVLNSLKSLLVKLRLNKVMPRIGNIYYFLVRELWPYPEIIEIQGNKMYMNIKKEESLSMRLAFQSYAIKQIHEKSTTELFKKIVKKGNTVVDLGANIGYFTLLAAKLVGPDGKVFAFEPEPKNYWYLKKNIELNNYHNIIALQKAVSNEKRKTKLYICDYDSGHHTINKYDGVEAYSRGRLTKENSIEIETITLDYFFKNQEEVVDVIKMDIEGAEALALDGMDNILRKNKKLKMFIEFFPLLIEKMGSSPKEFINKLLNEYCFSVYIIPNDYDASIREMKEVNTLEEVISFIKKETDHLNLFLKRK